MSVVTDPLREPGSFRDPAGFVFSRDGLLLRQVNAEGAADYRALMNSGLFDLLRGRGSIVTHKEVDLVHALQPPAAYVLEVERVPFISYPYEWSFSQLRDAALFTLDLQRLALERGMILRDASAYNIQWRGSQPVLIDTLSFGVWPQGSAWEGYAQFCRHFLAPLAIASATGPHTLARLRVALDGVPLPEASAALPRSTWLQFGLLTHLHLHAKTVTRHEGRSPSPAAAAPALTLQALLALTESLAATIRALRPPPLSTEWGNYYANTNYSAESASEKASVVATFLAQIREQHRVGVVWDLGANTGVYSRVASKIAHTVLAFDIDEAAVEAHFFATKREQNVVILPLRMDLRNPSPDLGWAHEERRSLEKRGPADVIMALALIHHLAISNNTPLTHLASYFSRLGKYAIVEMVPKEDSQVMRLLSSRRDIFPDYTIEGFERAFQAHFTILERRPVAHSNRILYLLESSFCHA